MTSIAMILAIGTVSAGAALAENATASLVPKFDPKLQRFDQSTFSGRLSKMLLACDPFLLTYSSEEVKKCKAMVDDYEHHLRNLPAGVSETEMSRKLWEAQVNKIRLIDNQPHFYFLTQIRRCITCVFMIACCICGSSPRHR